MSGSTPRFILVLIPHIVYPETKGIPLEEMDAVFGEGSSFLYIQYLPSSLDTCGISAGSNIPLHDYSEHVALVSRTELHDDADESFDYDPHHNNERPLHHRSRSGSNLGSADWLPVDRPSGKAGYEPVHTEDA